MVEPGIADQEVGVALSPTPWMIERGNPNGFIVGADGEPITDLGYWHEPNEKNIRYAVKAVNSHEDLISALMLAEEWAKGWLDNGYADQDALKADLALITEALENAK